MLFTGLTILSILSGVNPLSATPLSAAPLKCISKVQKQKLLMLVAMNPYFFPFSIKTHKCSGSHNNINDLYAKLCVPDVLKNLNLRAFNLMSITNEARHIEWHETCKCKCRLDATACNNKQVE